MKRKLPNTVGGRFAKVISRVYLDRTTSLVLVRILKEYYVILIGPNQATVVKKLDTIEEGEIDTEAGRNSSFESILQKFVGGKK
ncbi:MULTISPECIES: flagellar biosynthetic protein FliO [Fervidobacterium]|uniref:Flagellar biosynthetic protein FliO n=1 Tax=Fervidobacterium islandicum TaxID=2423 RepID=A0AAI8GCU6_FERIS|nr:MULTISPECIES: flagellar biosynthetic protein FliO [Fervidobacterium]AMW32311.2 flagellar biosynthetic protein FliO [Fervidobacterium islandicum]